MFLDCPSDLARTWQSSLSRYRHCRPPQIPPAILRGRTVSESATRRPVPILGNHRLKCVEDSDARCWDTTSRTVAGPLYVLNCDARHTASLPVEWAQNAAHPPVFRSQGSKENQETTEVGWENRSATDGINSNSGGNARSAPPLCVGLRRVISKSLIRSSRKNAPVTLSGRSPDLRLPTGIASRCRTDLPKALPQWRFGSACRSQWRDRAGLAPDFPFTPLRAPSSP